MRQPKDDTVNQLRMCAWWCVAGAAASALGLTNGDFQAGLDGWSPAELSSARTNAPSAQVTILDGSARLATSAATDLLVTVSQHLAWPSNALELRFDVRFERQTPANGSEPAGGFPDHFQAWFADDLNPAFSRAFAALTSFATYDPAAFTNLALAPLPDAWLRCRADVSQLAGRAGTLTFALYDNYDGHESAVRLDNVAVVVPPPEPTDTNRLARPFTEGWTLSRQTGTYFGSARLHNGQPPGGRALPGPFRLVLQASADTRLMKPDGTLPDGRSYLELSAPAGGLQPGQTHLIPGIEVYRRYRTPPPDSMFEILEVSGP